VNREEGRKPYLKPPIRLPDQPPKLIQRPLLPPNTNHHHNILPPQPLRLMPTLILIPPRQQLLNNQQPGPVPPSFQTRHHRFQDAYAFRVAVVVEAATKDEGVGVGARLGCVVVVGFEGDAVVGGFLGGGERGELGDGVLEDEGEVLVYGLKVGVLLVWVGLAPE